MTVRDIEPRVAAEITARLAAAETEHGVNVLYAIESGSRAWGFASPNSDYDVRFIYVHPRDWYLSFDVEHRRDVIEYPIEDEIDCSGWDLRKALYLFTRTNGALIEWLHSPIRYIERGVLAPRLRELTRETANLVALRYHYRHMAQSNGAGCLGRDEVRLKKYLYTLRPLFAIRWIEAGHGVPPVEFEQLVAIAAPAALRPTIADLVSLKRGSPELAVVDASGELNEFIDQELARVEGRYSGEGRPSAMDRPTLMTTLNDLFRACLDEHGV